MIRFSRLRLHGFKSFVDKTELDIGPGLTGIVGPNGCGKSNLVEALRWSMGESSAKRMRGGSGSMEDVIFNGTEKRPARGAAEVSVILDNSRRSAPSPWNDGDEIEVVRRIERDRGSAYHINGKPVRARDVQLLYADLVSGAGSPFLISQGKVTAMIQAKPAERRLILEEAAGISGLYARRHEAELRLRATDTNLQRLEDLLGGMEERLQNLKKQARQTAKYRNLSAQIRQFEIMVASLEWRRAHEKLTEIEKTFAAADSAVAERLTTVSQLTQTQNTQSADLPDLRRRDAEMAATLQTLRLALQRLEDEAERLSGQLAEMGAHLTQAASDRDHERHALTENTSILEKIEREEKDILSRRSGEDESLKEKSETRQRLEREADALEREATSLSESAAADRARKQSLEEQAAAARKKREDLAARIAELKTRIQAGKQEYDHSEKPDSLRADLESIEKEIATKQSELEDTQKKLEETRHARDTLRQQQQKAETEKSNVEAEIRTLKTFVKTFSGEGFRPVFEDIRTDKGFELALSRALGDTLMASADESAPVVWRTRDAASFEAPAFPAGIEPLHPYVKAPAALGAALRLIGLVKTDGDGDRLAAELKPGQSLVSREGAYWRWDGLHARASAADRHALQLQQKNRLADLEKSLPEHAEAAAEIIKKVKTKDEDIAKIQSRLSQTQDTLQENRNRLRDKRTDLDKALQKQSARQTELAKLGEALSLAGIDLQTTETALRDGEQALLGFDETKLAERQEAIESLREKLAAARTALQNAIRALDQAEQDSNRRKARLRAIADERVTLQNRCIRAREKIKELDERETSLKARIAETQRRPEVIKKDSEDLLSKIGVHETEKSTVSDKLALCEADLAETTKALKQAETLLSEAKEARAHAQATATERRNALDGIRAHIRETFDMEPQELWAHATLSDDALPDLDTLKQQKDKAVRDRDLIGPVNLCADQEAEDLEKQVGGLLNEKNDLAQAVAELREGIRKLNDEARERLQAAFTNVNAHFRSMFTRLFSGGNAHLSLIESDDPLEAGLEIFAQPPGKALQSLSLLSGGEQTLTAVALIFAMFLTNPSPICVLDEVDAPLDDANVDRFCDLLEEFAERGETRFLVITHHRLTMARMDRLYGVTMTERGVSQLVSVDLNRQMDLLDAA